VPTVIFSLVTSGTSLTAATSSNFYENFHDRRRYLHWLFEAKKRFGLSVLNYVVTCNHVHLLVKDTGRDVISQSIQLIAGRTAQEYNQRKNRQGAFWEDRYHATAIEADEHLHRCLVYIDLNMVRAGVLNHPIRWKHGGYREIQERPERYTVIDVANAEIAAALYVAEATVKTHVGSIFTKLGVRDRAAAIVFAYDHGVVSPGAAPTAWPASAICRVSARSADLPRSPGAPPASRAASSRVDEARRWKARRFPSCG